jgi:hypothetical protein
MTQSVTAQFGSNNAACRGLSMTSAAAGRPMTTTTGLTVWLSPLIGPAGGASTAW